jgi:hypothetical protein
MKSAIDAQITTSLKKCQDAKNIVEFERILRPPVIEFVERKIPATWHPDRKIILQLLKYANSRLEEELNKAKNMFKPTTTVPEAKRE